MDRRLISLLVLLAVVGFGLTVAWSSSDRETDRDSDLVVLEAPPDDFPLAPLPAVEGTLLSTTTRETAAMTMVTVQYVLADGVDEAVILERYGKVMASEGGRPVHSPGQVRAHRDRGMMAARIVNDDASGRVLTLVAVVTP